MVAMRVRDKDVRHRLAAHRIEQRSDVRLIVRTRIDDRDLASPDDVADRTLEGERAGVVRHDTADARRDLFGEAGFESEDPVVWNVVCHAGYLVEELSTEQFRAPQAQRL